MADINIIVNEEDKQEIWENEQARHHYEASGICNNVNKILSNKKNNSDEQIGVWMQLIDAEEEDFDIFKNLKGYQEIQGFGGEISGVNMYATQKGIFSKADLDTAKKKRGWIINELKKEGKKRSDPRLKRHYADMADILDEKKGNYTQMMFTSPYMVGLTAGFTGLNNPANISSAVCKEITTEPLFNASYDYLHAITDEVRIHYEKQKLDNNKNATLQDKGKYLADLKKTHEQFIKSYENLSTFQDDPDGRFAWVLGDGTDELYGRGEGKNRDIVGYAGMVIGEKKAIENGWNPEEFGVIAAIGSIDEQTKKIEKYASEARKEGLEQFKADFYRLKAECYNTKVDSAESKKVIADKVKAFVDSHQSPAAKSCMAIVLASKGALDSSVEAIEKSVEREKEIENPSVTLKNTNISEFLKEQERIAIETGDFERYADELAQAYQRQNQRGGMSEEQSKSFDDYTRSLYKKDIKFKEKLTQASTRLHTKNSIEAAREKEELAYRIRVGAETVEPQLEGIRQDYASSKIIAARKMKDSKALKRMDATSELNTLCFNMNSKGYTAAREKGQQDYMNNGCDGLSRQERDYYLKESKNFDDQFSINYGIEQDEKTGQITGTNERRMNEAVDRNISKSKLYVDKITKMTTEAKKKLETLDALRKGKQTAAYDSNGRYYDKDAYEAGGNKNFIKIKDANSAEFMNMYNSLKVVSEISVKDTPKDIIEKLGRLSDTSDKYKAKIDDHFFAGRKSAGKQRRRESVGLKTFADDYEKSFKDDGKGVVCPNETIEDMKKRHEAILEARNNKQAVRADAKAAAQGENALPKDGEYVNLDEALERAKGEIAKEAEKNGIGGMDKEKCQKPLACITTITFMKNQEKLTGKPLNYTKGDFNKELG